MVTWSCIIEPSRYVRFDAEDVHCGGISWRIKLFDSCFRDLVRHRASESTLNQFTAEKKWRAALAEKVQVDLSNTTATSNVTAGASTM